MRRFFCYHPISPLDGRYRSKVLPLTEFFSEKALVKYRIKTEIEWLKFLVQKQIARTNQGLTSIQETCNELNGIYLEEDFYERTKEIEATTNHDVKAVEYYVKEYMQKKANLRDITEFVHFTCTSEDVNNISYSLMLKESKEAIVEKELWDLQKHLSEKVEDYSNVAMLARTHGQSASPTTMGKEIANYLYRLNRQHSKIKSHKFAAKLNGAVGNYNAHLFVYPEYNWPNLSEEFITSLGLEWSPYSTQIENHDSMCEFFGYQSHVNTIMTGFCRDFWHYISLGYFKQKAVKGEVGSSTMPHKVNPIDFENAEGNFGLANALFEHFRAKLPISRYQRDLSDSTVLRNMGLGFGYTTLAYKSLRKGLGRVDINKDLLNTELSSHWELLAEPIQMMMRKHKVPEAYEKMKEVTRGHEVNCETIRSFVAKLDIPESDKKAMMLLTPAEYTGYAKELAENLLKNK